MNIYEWLEQVQKLDQLINAKLSEREQLWALATRVTPDTDGMPHGKGEVSDPVGNAVVKLVALAEEINQLVDMYVAHKQKVISALEELPAKEYGVLHRHYIKYMSWNAVAEDMGYCKQQIWRIRKKAISHLKDVIECYL